MSCNRGTFCRAAAVAALMVVAGLTGMTGVAAADPSASSPASLSPDSVVEGNAVNLTQGTWTTGTSPSTDTLNVSDAWSLCSGGNCAAAPAGAVSGNTYTTSVGDAGKTVQVVETAMDTTDGTSASQTLTANVTAAPPTATTNPVVSPAGTAAVGAPLTVAPANWTPVTAITDTWQSCAGATCTTVGTGATYTTQSSDVGHTVQVSETAVNGGTPADAPKISNAVSVPAANTTAPALPTGSQQVGQTLTAGNTGSWNFTPTTYTYQWFRCTPAAVCQAISSGANAANYVIKTNDQGDTLYVRITASGTVGTVAVNTFANSPQTGVIAPPIPTPVNTAAPTINGTPQNGQTLMETAAKWTVPAGAVTTGLTFHTTLQWWRCDSSDANCVVEPSGMATTLPLGSADVGGTIQVCETAVYTSGTTSGTSSTSCSGFTSAVTDVAGVVPVPTLTSAMPGLSGPDSLGGTLHASPAAFSNNPGTYTYQWQRCNALVCTDIAGANTANYTTGASDVGYQLQVVETASNSGGAGAPAISRETAIITAPSATSLQSNTTTPTAGDAVALIASVSSVAPSAESGTITFAADGAAIPGCSGLPLASDPTQPVICQAIFGADLHDVTASFVPGSASFVSGSASPSLTLGVGRTATSITLGADKRADLGADFTYRATLRPRATGPFVPGGKVAFLDAGHAIKGCGAKALKAGVATCKVRYDGLRTHTISVRYDGDANFTAARSATERITVVPQSPSGVVASYMSWTFAYGPTSTGVRELAVSGLVTGTKIAITCAGRGCAFHNYTRIITAATHCVSGHKCRPLASLKLTSLFKHRRLRIGSTLTVQLSHAGWVGKNYRFTVEHSRKPALRESCLAVGETRPSVGCTVA